MRPTPAITALLTSALLISACSSGEDDEDGPVGTDEINPNEQQPEDSTDEGSDDGGAVGGEFNSEEAAEGADAAYQQALEDSEELGSEEDYSEYEMNDQEFGDGDDFQQFLDDRTVVMERAAEIMTEFQAEDWNKDVAVIRANHLISEGAQQSGIPEAPQSGDPSWDSAMECGADAEVRTEVIDSDPDEMSHSPHTEIIAEYRWRDGDDGCEITQPDHYFVYVMTMGDDALITDFSRDQVSYDEDEPGLFDDDD